MSNPFTFSKHPAHLKAKRQAEYRKKQKDKSPAERIAAIFESVPESERMGVFREVVRKVFGAIYFGA